MKNYECEELILMIVIFFFSFFYLLKEGKCWVQGWTPPENDTVPENYILGLEDFTIFVRETVKFNRFGKTLTNAKSGVTPPPNNNNNSKKINQNNMNGGNMNDLGHENGANYHENGGDYHENGANYLENGAKINGKISSDSNNNNNPTDKPTLGVNLFRVGDLLAQVNLTLADVRQRGCVLGFRSTWDCDFDKDESACRPVHHLERLDDPLSNVSRGFNYRQEDVYWSPQLTDGKNRYLKKLKFFSI